ncbi:hypothetical protein OHS18_16195 [Amycolatopsis sp. NBC_00355]|uniref:hypothetical protein n=1 Tax=Amycolatopsis sp. NBC_00355 TaxID=2975957 RepID=UPI002E2629DD
MGRVPRFWFPLALLGFAQIGMVVTQLLARRSPAEGHFVTMFSLPMSQENARAADGIGRPRYSAQWLTQDDFYAPGAGLPEGPVWLVALDVVLLGAALWYALSLRRAGRAVHTGRFVLGTVAALLAVPLLDLVGSWQFRLGDGLRGPLLATLGLLALAACERSRLVLLTAAAFALVAVVLSADAAGVLVSAVILFAAAFTAVLRRRPDTAADTP